MARPRSTSAILDSAKQRLEALKNIEPNLDFGGGVSVATLTTAVDGTQTKQTAYNDTASELTARAIELDEALEQLRQLDSRVLSGVAAVYGRNSKEYGMVGGTRTSDRKPAQRKPKEPTP
ncbi:hypothetical protein [Armatimonas sp.]|uniref:hypothetical protein n=1 Tax=Armatimonas sp. TaxID=1872638 RepID=UPI00374D8569